MTAVIGRRSGDRYRRDMALPDVTRLVAAVLLRPAEGYLTAVDAARRAAGVRSVEAARQLEVFTGRVGDLTLDELRELYDETFAATATVGIVGLARQLASGAPRGDALRAGIGVVAGAIERLDADRNPFAYAARALFCVILALLNPVATEPTATERRA
jgi:hypothetical protein